jgi:hypothetical protein
MTSTYSLVLAAEGSVVAVAGLVIAYLAATRRDVVLYAGALAVFGLGLGAAGVGTMLLAFDRSTPATATMAVAALAYVASGWRIAVDAIQPDESFATEQLASEPTTGFEGNHD